MDVGEGEEGEGAVARVTSPESPLFFRAHLPSLLQPHLTSLHHLWIASRESTLTNPLNRPPNSLSLFSPPSSFHLPSSLPLSLLFPSSLLSRFLPLPPGSFEAASNPATGLITVVAT